MKKSAAVLLALGMAVMGLAGCSGSSNSTATTAATEAAATTAETTTAAARDNDRGSKGQRIRGTDHRDLPRGRFWYQRRIYRAVWH